LELIVSEFAKQSMNELFSFLGYFIPLFFVLLATCFERFYRYVFEMILQSYLLFIQLFLCFNIDQLESLGLDCGTEGSCAEDRLVVEAVNFIID